ncbi:UMP-CMP kinase 3, partial [Tanacetum coccineum]
GREDDNIDTIRKRFKVFLESSLPVIEYYNSKGKVRKIDAAKPAEEVFETVKALFTPVSDKVKQFMISQVSGCCLGVIYHLHLRSRLESSLVDGWYGRIHDENAG